MRSTYKVAKEVLAGSKALSGGAAAARALSAGGVAASSAGGYVARGVGGLLETASSAAAARLSSAAADYARSVKGGDWWDPYNTSASMGSGTLGFVATHVANGPADVLYRTNPANRAAIHAEEVATNNLRNVSKVMDFVGKATGVYDIWQHSGDLVNAANKGDWKQALVSTGQVIVDVGLNFTPVGKSFKVARFVGSMAYDAADAFGVFKLDTWR